MSTRNSHFGGGSRGSTSFAPNPVARADDIMQEGDRFQQVNDRKRRDAVMKSIPAGTMDAPRAGMSRADQNTLAQGELQRRGDPFGDTDAEGNTRTVYRHPDPTESRGSGRALPIGSRAAGSRDPVAEAQANADVARSKVPLNINTPNALAAGATAASSASRTPQATRFVAPAPLTGPTGNRTTDAAALAANLAQTQPGGLRSANQTAPDPTQPASITNGGLQRVAAPSIGHVVANGQDVTGPNGYGTGSVSYVKPGDQLAGPSQVTDTGVIGQSPGKPFDQQTAHNELFKTHPEIWKPGSPQNLAFLAHAQKYGQASAYQNAPALMATLNPSSGDPTSQTVKNDLPNEDQAARDARMAATTAGIPQKPLAQRAGEAAKGVGETISSIGSSIANAPRTAANAIDKIVSQAATGLTGQPQDLHPIASTGRAVKNMVTDVGKAYADTYEGGASDLRTPSAAPNPPEDEETRRKRLEQSSGAMPPFAMQ